MAKVTPMIAQYLDIKSEYQDAILLYRLGDFYEMFFEDAQVASQILEITLTARNKKGKGEEVPMCGVPYHSVENYINKLIKAGKKVAICEQTSPPNNKGIVKREVVRVITPGTVLSENILENKKHNYLLSITSTDSSFQLAYCDLSTGDIISTNTNNIDQLKSELTRIDPTEVILGEEKNYQHIANYLKVNHPTTLVNYQQENTANTSEEILVKYLTKTQKTPINHLKEGRKYTLSEHLILDKNCLQNLEIFYTYNGEKAPTLLKEIDHTKTAMGGRFLRNSLAQPLCNLEKIQYRLNKVETFFKNPLLCNQTTKLLSSFYDIDRLLSRINLSYANARDLVKLQESLQIIPTLKQTIKPSLPSLSEKLTVLPNLTNTLEQALRKDPPIATNQGGMIKKGYNEKLDKLLDISQKGKTFISKLQQQEISSTGINSLKIKFNKVFGYYIEVSKSNSHLVPEHYIRKQTLVNAERYITPELKEFEQQVLSAEEEIKVLEQAIFQELCSKITNHNQQIQNNSTTISLVDFFQALATTAVNNNYCKPQVHDGFDLQITQGRHPVIENIVGKTNFISNDCNLNQKSTFNLITGPNMGGKSTYLRQNAIIVLLAHIGSYVPAQKATIPLTDRIFTRVGASDNLSKGHSTFMVEMLEASEILHKATRRSLVILDELGRGTSTYDGLSLAWSITDYLHNKTQAKTLFATHYHELIEHVNHLEKGQNLSVAVAENKQKEIIFLYKIIAEATSKSYGIEVAKLAGLPAEVIQHAKSILLDLESKHDIQPTLFSSAPRDHQSLNPLKQEILDEIASIDHNNTTPIKALQLLIKYQNKLSES